MSCILVNKKYGIFAAMMDLGDGEAPMMVFTLDHENKMAVEKVTAFLNPLIATNFLNDFVEPDEIQDYMILMLNKKSPKQPNIATYKDILDNGYQEWAGYMIDTEHFPSKAIH